MLEARKDLVRDALDGRLDATRALRRGTVPGRRRYVVETSTAESASAGMAGGGVHRRQSAVHRQRQGHSRRLGEDYARRCGRRIRI